MRYENVCLETLAYTLPDEVVTSAQVEAQLEPLYRRLKLPEGRLELMTGIAQRRFWPASVLPSQISIQTADKAIRAAGTRSKSYRRPDSRLGMPRSIGAGHRLCRAPAARPGAGLRGVRRIERLPGPDERRGPGR